MAITSSGHENPTRFFGLAGDTKPTSAMVGATFYETDTPDLFVFDGASWVSFRLNVDLTSATIDLMLGSDFTTVFGTSDLTLSGQGDNLTNAVLVLKTASLLYGYDGNNWDRVRATAADGMLVNLGTNNDVTVTGDALTALQLIDNLAAAHNAGGCKMFTSIDLDQTEEDITTGATTIYGMYVWNATAAPLWLQMFNTNTVTVGTTAPTNNFPIPANADSDVAGVVTPIPVNGAAYSTALTVAITTGSGTDAGAPGANDAGIVVFYQD